MLTLMVLGDLGDSRLRMLERLGSEARIVRSEGAEEADVALVWNINRAELDAALARAGRLRWIHSASVGVDSFLSPALRNHPAILTNARGIYSDSLAEFAVLAMLFFAKDVRRLERARSGRAWDPFDCELLKGKTLGVIGYGSIGQAAAERARGFGMRIVAVRRGSGELAAALAESDYVVLATPLTAETRGMIGAAELNAMKPNAVLINVGRGPVIDEPALVEALEGKRIRGAALDVFNTEPLPADHPFWRLDNVLISPHSADHVAGWLEASVELFLENFERFRRGEPLKNVVDKERGY